MVFNYMNNNKKIDHVKSLAFEADVVIGSVLEVPKIREKP